MGNSELNSRAGCDGQNMEFAFWGVARVHFNRNYKFWVYAEKVFMRELLI
jgi:hypothetical protein